MTTAAIIVAAGTGQRFGDAGKSFASVLGQPMAWWSLQTALASPVDEIVLVCGAHSVDAATQTRSSFGSSTSIRIVLGGERRQDSVLAGIEATSAGTDLVVIHDAARPLVTPQLFERVISAASAHGAAIPGVPVSDTIKRVSGEQVVATVSRDDLVSVQTPQAFDKNLLLEAFDRSRRTGVTVTDEATLMEAAGFPVVVVPGQADNMKVTFPGDLAVVEALLRARQR